MGTVEWLDLPEPVLDTEQGAIVRPLAVSRCDIDPRLLRAGPGGEPFAVGHEAVVEVIEVGEDVARIRPGDVAVPAFQVSCGRCEPCRGRRSSHCGAYPMLSDYGMRPLSGIEFGGMMSDLVRVPHADQMLHRVPDGVSIESAVGVADNVADGFRAVAPHLEERPGAPVLVCCHGGGSIALFAVLSALALGADEVAFASDEPHLLEHAARLGAAPLDTDFARRDSMFPIVVDCGSRPEGLRYAISSTAPEGTCQSVSLYADSPEVELPLVKMYIRGVRFLIGRLHSTETIPAVLDLVAAGRLRPEQVTTNTVAWDDAAAAYVEPATKLVVRR